MHQTEIIPDTNAQMSLYPVSAPIVAVKFPRQIPATMFERLTRANKRYTDIAVRIKYDLEELNAFEPGFRIEDWFVDFVLFMEVELIQMVHALNIHIGSKDDRYTHKKYIENGKAIFEVSGSPVPNCEQLFDIIHDAPRACQIYLEKDAYSCHNEGSYCIIANIVSEEI
jgi:hypothetical protein